MKVCIDEEWYTLDWFMGRLECLISHLTPAYITWRGVCGGSPELYIAWSGIESLERE